MCVVVDGGDDHDDHDHDNHDDYDDDKEEDDEKKVMMMMMMMLFGAFQSNAFLRVLKRCDSARSKATTLPFRCFRFAAKSQSSNIQAKRKPQVCHRGLGLI